MDVVKVNFDLRGDPAFARVDDFVASQLPDNVGYILRICNISDPNDHCKLPPMVFKAIPDKDFFVDSIVVSAELGDGSDAEYSPKEVKLFFWEGNVTEELECQDECYENVDYKFCKDDDLGYSYTKVCGGASDGGECLEFKSEAKITCGSSEFCVDGDCVYSPCKKVQCREFVLMKSGCVDSYDDECIAPIRYDFGMKTGGCGTLDIKDEYACFNYKDIDSVCSENPTCPAGSSPVAGSEVPCICDEVVPVVDDEDDVCVDTTWTPARSTVCSGESFIQTSNCGNERSKTGTKDCCVVSSWTPATGTVCSGVSFTQTSNCGTTRTKIGTKTCAAKLSLDFSNVQYKWISPYHYYYHTRTFKETGGVGVTLTKFEICPKYVACNSISVNRRVEANSPLVLTNQNVYTSFGSDEFTLTYTGTDDKGNLISVQEVVSVSGSNWISP